MMNRRLAPLILACLTVMVWNAQPGVVAAQGRANPSQQTRQERATAYERAMRIGYAATEQGDYQTALINFRRALAARPGDRYATTAIRNVQSYIQRIRDIEARNQRIIELQATFDEATTNQDWACAVGVLDRLIELTQPNSLERANMVAYRGELAGLLDTRTNLEQWSTVCSLTPYY